MPRSPKCQKAILVLLGLLLSLLILEIGLNLAGFTLTVLQENRNRISLKTESDYRILCLGESTTQGEYPPFLAASLNRNDRGVKFAVFDQGKGGTNTNIILKDAETYLDQYHPDMVVAMMGINDGIGYLPQEDPSASAMTLFLQSFKTYKLARMLWLHMVIRAQEADLPIGASQTQDMPAPGDSHKKYENPISNQGRLARTEAGVQRIYSEAVNYYQQQRRFGGAEGSLKKALELNPRDERLYVELGSVYRRHGRFGQAKASLEKARKLNPGDAEIYREFASIDKDQGEFALAESSLEKSLELDPKNGQVYFELGNLHQQQGQPTRAEVDFRKGLELNPENEQAYVQLASVYRQQGQLKQAARRLKAVAEHFGPHARGLYEESAAARRAEYYNQANQTAAAATTRNYRALKVMLDKRKIRLVCVQYPMRPVAALKKIFAGEAGAIIFVGNENNFGDAVRQNGLDAYFRDMFAGNFGHCTDRGNKLLGDNIAQAIMRELFGR